MFMLVARRYERAALIVTSNKPFCGLGRDLRRRRHRRRDDRPARPPRRDPRAQRRQLPPQRPRPRPPRHPRRLTARGERRSGSPYGLASAPPAANPPGGPLFDRRYRLTFRPALTDFSRFAPLSRRSSSRVSSRGVRVVMRLQPVGLVSGHGFRREGVRGAVWYAKYRLPDGRPAPAARRAGVEFFLGWSAAGCFTRRLPRRRRCATTSASAGCPARGLADAASAEAARDEPWSQRVQVADEGAPPAARGSRVPAPPNPGVRLLARIWPRTLPCAAATQSARCSTGCSTRCVGVKAARW